MSDDYETKKAIEIIEALREKTCIDEYNLVDAGEVRRLCEHEHETSKNNETQALQARSQAEIEIKTLEKLIKNLTEKHFPSVSIFYHAHIERKLKDEITRLREELAAWESGKAVALIAKLREALESARDTLELFDKIHFTESGASCCYGSDKAYEAIAKITAVLKEGE